MQPVVPCPTVKRALLPPLAHCSWLPIPATSIKRVPLATLTVQFRYVVPCSVCVVAGSDTLDAGRLEANLDLEE